MIAKAHGKFLRVSPTKVRPVIDLLRGKPVQEASVLLYHVNQGCVPRLRKILNSAVSNAKQSGLSENQLFISRITADQGPSWKRFRASAFGRASGIIKRTTHLTIELDLVKS